MTIHKELEREKWEATPLGQKEVRLKKFYKSMQNDKKVLPEDYAKRIYDIRDAHEKEQLAYIEKTEKEQALAVDAMLAVSFDKEIAVIEEYEDTLK